ncbi:hypothetical protein FL857_10790 [Criibacterium bergeronii]|uniref:Antitoxin epsilon/PezA domain-containing protein n=1 Tax=Criibacterium bergeronii TaxID=1871336 RepID=A0A552UXE8_9FIRM|nr:hypothetical protein [Criibacterium bergeronii]TRW22888.1 hypothetical protein FL857_10790 [Criibacterium bergeronii]
MEIKDDRFYSEEEVLSEYTAEVLSEFVRYFNDEDLDSNDKTNPFVLIYSALIKEKSRLYGNTVNTMEDLKIIENNFKFSVGILRDVKKVA